MGLFAAASLFLLFLSGSLAACQNGGLQVGAKCNCPPLWTGDNCETIQCINGGYKISATNTNRCVCPTGYMGVHCDAVTTYKRPQNAFPNPKTSFNLVMVNVFSQYWGGLLVSQFQTAINNHLKNLKNLKISPYNSMNLVTNANAPQKDSNTNDPSVYAFTSSNYTSDQGLPPIQGPGTYKCYQIPFYQNIVELIKNQNLRETAITIITQHPPLSETDAYNRLVELATSFDIRINVIWSDDDTFVRCLPQNSTELMGLTAKTGGMFVQALQIEDYEATNTIMDVILASHFRYEAIAMDYGGNSTVTFRMNMPFTKNYYAIALTDDGIATSVTLNLSSCIPNPTIIQTGAVAQASSFTAILPICTIQANSQGGKARLQVFGSDLSSGPISVRFYKSYVEATNYDTSNSQPDQGNSLSLTLYVDNYAGFDSTVTSAYLRSEDHNEDLDIGVSSRNDSVFDIISEKPIVCQTQIRMWIELTLASNLSVFAPEKRFIPIYCVEQPAAKPKSVAKSWWTPMEEHFEEDFIDVSGDSTCDSINKTRSLILAYSDLSDELQYNTYILATIPPNYTRFGDYGEVRFDVNTTPTFHSQGGDNDAFNYAVYTTYKPDPNITIENTASSQVLEALKSIASSPDVQQNSLVTVMLTRFPDKSNLSLIPYYPLVNKNVRVVFFMDMAALDKEVGMNKNGWGDILNQIAAITGGHFIVSNQNNKTLFNSILTNVYSLGAGQNLLLSKNIQKPKSNDIIGNIDLSNISENVTITVTLSTAVSGNSTDTTAIVYQPQIFFINQKTQQIAAKAILAEVGGITNYYSASVVLPAGASYQVKVISLLTQKQTLLRVWSTDTILTDVQVGYKDLNDKDLDSSVGPDSYNGAALAVNLQDITDAAQLTLDISDCSGNAITLYDSLQNFDISGCDPVRFVPFFCSKPTDTSNCQPGTENLYFAQITSKMSSSNSTGFVGTKTFMCSESSIPIIDNCKNQDGNGNYICGGSTIPYTRGPSGKLIDCSDPTASHLKYDPASMPSFAPYSCNCPGGPQEGASCQSATCIKQNTNGGAVDSMYRTYTVVIGVDKAYSGAEQWLFEDASGVLNNTGDNIWQYQLFATCYNGDLTPIYIGTDPSAFSDAFEAPIRCDSPDDPQNFDLTSIYRSALSSVGRQQRGLFAFFHELASDSFPLVKVEVPDLEEFIELAQQYKQQLYVYNAYAGQPSAVSENIRKAVMMTGGAVLTASLDDDATTNFFSTILSQSTSLNAHGPLFAGSNSVTMDAEGYLIVGTQTGDLTTSSVLADCDGSDTVNSKFAVLCHVASGSSVLLSYLPSDAWFSVVSLANTPVAVFISGRTDDQSSAFAVNYTVGGPTLAVAAPIGWSITGNTDKSARSAQRNSCTFVETTVNVFKQLAEGYSSITLTMQNGAQTVTKVIPFGVSSSIACANGNAIGDRQGLCFSQKNWTGPDNSIPVCLNGGSLSTWNNACICRGTGKVGQFCEKDASSSVQATTVVPTVMGTSEQTTTVAVAEQVATTTA